MELLTWEEISEEFNPTEEDIKKILEKYKASDGIGDFDGSVHFYPYCELDDACGEEGLADRCIKEIKEAFPDIVIKNEDDPGICRITLDTMDKQRWIFSFIASI